MYVIFIYKRTKEFKCYLVQMMLTSHHRKISDSQPMISLNGPKQLVAVRYKFGSHNGTTIPFSESTSRETSEVYIICIYVVLYYVLCQLTRKVINKTASIGILVIGEYANNRITSFFDVQGDKNHRPYFAAVVLLIRSNDLEQPSIDWFQCAK